ncbi:class I adenylate-forming enzyme family protein [Polaromonas sp.]|uniref:class I adenylate-forming enzyme family protein n=1 Tax=Polaromonas sp. TaxID=1869339 RepID=UPI003BA8C7A9
MTTKQLPGTVGAALALAAETHHQTAYICGEKNYSWQEVDAVTSKLAVQFQAMGLGKGDRIGVILLNQIEWIYTYFAAAKIGAVVVGMSVRYRDNEIDYMLNDSRIKAVVSPREFSGFDYVKFFAEGRQRFPALQHTIYVGEPQAGGGVNFSDLLAPAKGTARQPAGAPPDADDLVMIIYTSGTTGQPKAAGLTHRSQLASARAQSQHTRMSPDDLMQLAMPLNHVGGITCGVLSMMLAGGSCELVPAFSPDAVLGMMQRHPPTLFVGVPTMITLLLMSPRLATADFSRVRLVIIGGSNVEAALLTRLQAAVPGVSIMNLYGLSESSGAIVMTPWDCSQDELLGSIGKPLAGAEARVVSAAGTDMPVGEVGELWFRGASVIPAYVGAQQSTGTFDAQGWLHSGDLGYLNDAGLIYLMGRQKDMYIQGGFNVYPAEIEGVIAMHPDVLMVAGIGVPDQVLGEVGRYYIIRKEGRNVTEQDIQEFCRNRLADYKVPRQVVFRTQLPMTPAGKIQKAALRAE